MADETSAADDGGVRRHCTMAVAGWECCVLDE